MTAFLARPSRYIATPTPMQLTLLTGVAKNPVQFKTQGFLPGQIALVKSLTAAISLYMAKMPGSNDTTRRASFIKAAAGEEAITLPASVVAIPAHADADAVVGTNIAAPTSPQNVMNIIVLINGVVATRRGQDVADGALAASEFKATAAGAIRVNAPLGAHVEVLIPSTQTQATGGALTQYRTYEVELESFAYSNGTVEILDAIAR